MKNLETTFGMTWTGNQASLLLSHPTEKLLRIDEQRQNI